jgi:hypothetical protein
MLLRLIQGKDEHVRADLVDRFAEITLIPHFADKFYVRLVGNRSHY